MEPTSEGLIGTRHLASYERFVCLAVYTGQLYKLFGHYTLSSAVIVFKIVMLKFYQAFRIFLLCVCFTSELTSIVCLSY
jgi:hypothetical protein